MTFQAYTSSGLLPDIRRRCWMPSGDTDFTDAVLLKMADEVIEGLIFPRLLKQREEYYVMQQDITIVANQAGYKIPSRAWGGEVRALSYIDPSSNGVNMSRLPLERRDEYAASGSVAGQSAGFCIQGDLIVLLPTPTAASGTIRVKYCSTPNRLIAWDATDQDKVSTRSSDTAYALAVGGKITSGQKVDFISGTSPFHIRNAVPVEATAAGANLTVSPGVTYVVGDSASGAPTGDYVCQQGETTLPQLPSPLHPVLAQAVAMKVLEYRGDRGGKKIAEEEILANMEKVMDSLSPRVDGSKTRIVNRNSPLRRRSRYGR